ncbi:MAG: VWA domain-containing protein [Euryarchaeota archaeon]|nr:VWA domain-containing protein [Euryarchaeota archaeon]MBU4339612.1 VWA domain-containing protein [Euryarchaeota archaeon]MBU4453705.1 VWA domain-containing protein [Euryarchaeota archaeon]MCG2736620.1 VWA domain-containing protein [Candidatus Methanoperedenaceae archaeon]
MIQFQYPLAVFMVIPVILAILYYLKPRGAKAILLVASKLLIISIILLSIASPYTEEYVQGMTGTADITIIADRTESMRLFPPPDEIYDYLSNRTPTAIDHISGTSSPIGDAIIRNAKSGGSILLISDGNNNIGKSIPEAVSFARSLNTTVYYLRHETVKKDMRVSIEGDAVAVLDTQADFNVNVISVGDIEGDLKVWIDGKVVLNDRVSGAKKIPLTYSFDSVGSHTIKAELTALDDEFPQNNVFYRSVHVAPRPQILFVSNEDSPLSQIIKGSYSVYDASSPADAAGYKAVILDDVSAKKLSFSNALTLSDYVINGGGLVVVGGHDAYSDYSKLPLFEQLIPVKYGGVPPISAKTAVVLIVDISGSTGGISGAEPKLGIEKGLALQVLNDMGAGDFIGVIAFNNAPHTIVPFAQLAERSEAEDAIQRLRYGGTTRLSPALAVAHDMLRDFDGGRNVIVISDGAVADSDASIKAARSMSDGGISIYAIGVGGDTDVEFMMRLAEAGGGGYLRRDAAHGIKVLFGEKESRDRGDGYPLLIMNSGHFITQDFVLNATVYGYNNVHAKQNAQALVMTGNGNPVITSWRAGLGRVVSITVDNGNAWAPALYGAGNSRLIASSINYAIGTPDGLELRALDEEVGEPVDVLFSSDSEPVLSFDGTQLQFERTGEKQFHAAIYPNSTGFHDISGYTVAVNGPKEYRETGNNELIAGIITAGGGHVFDRSRLEQLIPEITARKTGMVKQVIDLRPVFLLAALLFYSIEVIFRRIADLLR